MNGPGHNGSRAALARIERLGPERVGIVLLALAMAAAAALLLWMERGALYASDEWSWIYIAGVESFETAWQPLNQHLMVLPLLTYKGLIALWGISFLPFKLAAIVVTLACSALVYVFARRRIGPILALAPAMMPLFFGTATAIILQPLVAVQLIGAAGFGVGAMLAVELNTRRADLLACALLCLSICCFSFGIAFLAGVAVAVLLGGERLSRAYVFLVPLALYAGWRLWALKFGLSGGPELANVPILHFYYVDSLAATATAMFGLSTAIVGNGPATALFLEGFSLHNFATTVVIATFEVVVVVYAVRRLRRRGAIPATMWSALAILLTLWTLQGLVLNEGRTPGETRYLYASGVALMLVAAEAARGARLSRVGTILVLAVAGAGIVGNLPHFQEGRDGIVMHSARARAYTTAMELAGANANPDFIPAVDAPEVAPAGVLYFSVAMYLDLEDRYGSLADSVAELGQEDEAVRNGADVVAARIVGLELTDAPGLPTRGCERYETAADGGFVDLPDGGAVVQASRATALGLRRFATRTLVPLGELAANRPATLRIPPDRAAVPWKLDAGGPLSLTVCKLP